MTLTAPLYLARRRGVLSVEPSSTTITSNGRRVWLRTESTARAIFRALLYVGTKTLIFIGKPFLTQLERLKNRKARLPYPKTGYFRYFSVFFRLRRQRNQILF